MPVCSLLVRICLLTVIPVFVSPGHAVAVPPAGDILSLHPDNPHYFLWRGRPTVLVTSGEHYGALLNRDFDYTAYLEELQAHGLNHTRVFTGIYRENEKAFNITDNTLAPAANSYLCPWKRSDAPGYNAGGNRFDLTQWDEEWFARLRGLLTEAAARDIVVELTLFCPMYRDDMWADCPMNVRNNVNGIGHCNRDEVYTLQQKDLLQVQKTVTRRIVTELREFDNLYYEVCNEPYFGGVTMDWQHAIIDVITETEASFPSQHLISLNIANGRQQIAQPHPAVSIFNFHYCVPPDTVAMNYGLNKVIGENETGFRGTDDILYRTEAWDFLLSGGALFNNLDYSFTVQHPRGTFRDYKSPGGGSCELRSQLSVLKRLLDSVDLISMSPDTTSVTSVSPDLTVTVLSEVGRTYVACLHVPLPNKPKALSDHLRDNVTASLSMSIPAGRYRVDWRSTLTGETIVTQLLNHAGGDVSLMSPPFNNDISLFIRQP